MHAKLLGHSEFKTHSYLQLGGEPMKFGKQEHDGYPLVSLHCALIPQGDGLQG